MKTSIINPKLSVVGAGPGDPELLTIKAVRALNSADVVLYDALVDPKILKHVPFGIPKIFVGKRKGQHSLSQDEINQLIISFAYTHGHVVRLKGGDPFVFGRGAEEILFAESFNIETQYIPGISSSVGVAGLAGIPVTHRGLSESFWVITGTTKENNLSKDVFAAAKTNATVVILMGINKIAEIASVFKLEGKGDLPVAIIQSGATLKENHILGTIHAIEAKAKEELTEGPGIIVIGDVVRLHKYFEAETGGSLEIFTSPLLYVNSQAGEAYFQKQENESPASKQESAAEKNTFRSAWKFLLN